MEAGRPPYQSPHLDTRDSETIIVTHGRDRDDRDDRDTRRGDTGTVRQLDTAVTGGQGDTWPLVLLWRPE